MLKQAFGAQPFRRIRRKFRAAFFAVLSLGHISLTNAVILPDTEGNHRKSNEPIFPLSET
jgi:hypothetical protein